MKKIERFAAAAMATIRAHAFEMGIAELSAKTGLARETLYRTISEKGNPRLATLVKIMGALGLEFRLNSGGGKKGGT